MMMHQAHIALACVFCKSFAIEGKLEPDIVDLEISISFYFFFQKVMRVDSKIKDGGSPPTNHLESKSSSIIWPLFGIFAKMRLIQMENRGTDYRLADPHLSLLQHSAYPVSEIKYPNSVKPRAKFWGFEVNCQIR